MFKYILLFCLTTLAYADHRPIVNSPIIEEDTVNNTDNSTTDNSTLNNTYIENSTTIRYSGIALGIAASQHNFSAGTYKYQGSVGIGSYNGSLV